MHPDTTIPVPDIVGSPQHGVTIGAPAKLNLSLAVSAVRDDGYHSIRSLMAPLELADQLTLTPCPDGPRLTLGGPQSAGVPVDQTNLAWRAAELLAESVNRPADVRIELVKHVPAGGGLGGGSSDAAATLRGLCRLWELDLSREELIALAADLGSDVPFCVVGEPAWVAGRGERVSVLDDPLGPLWALLVTPGFSVSTRAVYEQFDRRAKGTSKITRIIRRYGLAGLELHNDLEEAAFEVCPDLGRLFERLDGLGVPRLMLAGSGSTLFSLFDDPNEMQHWEDRIHVHLQCPVTSTAVRRRPRAAQRDA